MDDDRSKSSLQSEPRRLLATLLVTLAVGLILIVLLRGTPQSWCNFTEFGYLSRIPSALALIAEVGLAVLLALGGFIWYLGGHAPKLPYVIAGGLLSAVALSFVVPPPSC